MAEQGTFLGEVQRGWTRFWGTSWKVKGPVLGVVAILVIAGMSGATGGDTDDPGEQASADSEPSTPEGDEEIDVDAEPEDTATPEPTAMPEDTPTPTNTPEPTATPTPEPTATPTPSPIGLSGAGQGTDNATLGEGIWWVDLEHDGSSNFSVWAYAESGDEELLVNEIGSYAGRRWLVGDEMYLFDIDADGSWSITLRPMESELDASSSLSGSGDYVSGTFIPEQSGPAPWTFVHEGSSNFAVWLQCDTGSDLVQNEIGPVDASTVVNVPDDAAVCFWDVTAHEGTWNFAIE